MPGEDAVWLQVKTPSLPDGQKHMEAHTAIPDVKGRAGNPCKMEWPANDIRVVANSDFMAGNTAVKKPFEEMSIPLEDIFARNALMYRGEDKPADPERQAGEWIKGHRQTFDGWIEAARPAAK